MVSAANGTEDASYGVIRSHTDVEPVESQRPPKTFDHPNFYLGELCPRGHEWNGTGKTLKKKKGNKCAACENERKREKRLEAKRQATAPSRP